MKKLLACVPLFVLVFVAGRLSRDTVAEAAGGGGAAVVANGDVNGDGGIDVSDASYLLNWLFLGGPEPEPFEGGSGPFGLPASGQTTCYDASGKVIDCTSETCAGQDGLYATGCPSESRFVDNGDGTVTDNCTGLMWEKDTGNSGNNLDWCEALTYCESLDLAGYDDWRLPNVTELQSIVDYERKFPAIDPVFTAASSFYWSSTSYVDVPANSMLVSFGIGTVAFDRKGARFYTVRAVRTDA